MAEGSPPVRAGSRQEAEAMASYGFNRNGGARNQGQRRPGGTANLKSAETLAEGLKRQCDALEDKAVMLTARIAKMEERERMLKSRIEKLQQEAMELSEKAGGGQDEAMDGAAHRDI